MNSNGRKSNTITNFPLIKRFLSYLLGFVASILFIVLNLSVMKLAVSSTIFLVVSALVCLGLAVYTFYQVAHGKVQSVLAQCIDVREVKLRDMSSAWSTLQGEQQTQIKLFFINPVTDEDAIVVLTEKNKLANTKEGDYFELVFRTDETQFTENTLIEFNAIDNNNLIEEWEERNEELMHRRPEIHIVK